MMWKLAGFTSWDIDGTVFPIVRWTQASGTYPIFVNDLVLFQVTRLVDKTTIFGGVIVD